MDFELKPLHRGDEAVLGDVAPGLFDRTPDPRAVRGFLADPRHHIAVAIDKTRVVAFASGFHYFHPDKPIPELFVNEVGVAPSHRRMGLGKAVLGTLWEEARRKGCETAWVLTSDSNAAASRLYASMGGEAESEPSRLFSFRLSEV